MNSRFLLLSGCALMLLVTGGCRHVSVQSASVADAEFAAYDSYAWSPRWPSPPLVGKPVQDEGLRNQVTEAIGEHFQSIGLAEVAPENASLLVRYRLGIDIRVEHLAAYYTQDNLEKHEDGVLVVEVVDAATNRVVWRGQGRKELRLVARGSGLYRTHWRDLERVRRWKVDDVVAETLQRSELMETTVVDRTDPGGNVREGVRRDLYERIEKAAPDPEPVLPPAPEEKLEGSK